MFEVTIINKTGMRIGGDKFVTKLEADKWATDEEATGTLGKPARWLPDFLEGAETRQVSGLVNDKGIEYEKITEYLHPAEYTIEIVEESLDIIKARKIAELRAMSLSSNDELIKWNSYITASITAGVYEAEGTPEKAELYRTSFVNKTLALKTELRRCEALVNAATSEEEVNNVTFNVA